MQNVFCVNEKKKMVFTFVSIKHASIFTKTNIRTVHEILKGKRTNPPGSGWMFYRDIEHMQSTKNAPKKHYDCEVHQVNLAKGAECPLCKYDEKNQKIKLSNLFSDI